MLEIIIGIIIQVTTILNGGTSEQQAAEQKIAQEKAKTEQTNSTSSTAPADGGQGTWND